MQNINVYEAGEFSEQNFKRLLVHDSPYMKVLNFNFKAGQEMPIHSHDIEGKVSMMILEGEGELLGGTQPVRVKKGDVLVCDIAEPHGLMAITDLRLLVTIAPPI